MVRFGLVETGRYAAALLGALLLAGLVQAAGGEGGFVHAAMARLMALAHFDFGISAMTGAPALPEVLKRLPATFALLGGGAVIALMLGIPLGLILSWGRALRAGAPLIQIVAAAPVFCAGLALLFLAHHANWDVSAQTGLGFWPSLLGGDVDGVQRALTAFGLPVLVVGAAGAAAIQLAIRRAAKSAVREPYRESLRLMGLGVFEIDRRYLAPRVLAGLFANLGEVVLSLFAATAVAEWVFAWPGAATLFIRSVALGDWDVAALVLLVFAGLALTADFLGHILARALGDA
ncbi:MAG TPA: ABC transporter permease subunit [Rhizomicrobium sp.]|jgi:peptide/nickel transport system permease protein